MKLEKAIKILTTLAVEMDAFKDKPNAEAVRLGIEAMKLEVKRRGYWPDHIFPPLPGETKE